LLENELMSEAIGTVTELWRYPVKSMLGERCEHLDVEARGAAGDRLYAVRDADGRLGSGKNSHRHRRIEGLFEFRAVAAAEAPQITFPDGRRMLASDPGVHAALSATLGVPVTLAVEKEVPHHDAEPLHLVTTASLAWLRALRPDARIDERRFRPNLLIDVPGEGQVEREWVGRTLRAGEAVLRVVERTGRCVMITMPQSELEEQPGLLRTLSQGGGEPLFGVYAEVLSPGRIRLGDEVVLT
jgi:uncharacterized protein